MDINKNVKQVIAEKGSGKQSIIPILQAIQEKYNYLPQEALETVVANTEITPAEITSVATFYGQFRLNPAGKNMVKVCVGTACHVKGANLVYDAFKRELNLKDGADTDADGNYTLEKVSCLGCCTLAPVVQINDITYGHVKTDQTKQIITDFESLNELPGKKQYRTAKGGPIKGEIRIGLGSCCVASGSEAVKLAIEKNLAAQRMDVAIKQVGCVGMCHQVPLLEVIAENKPAKLYAKVSPDDVKSIINKHFQPKGFFNKLKHKLNSGIENIQYDANWDGVERYGIDIREQRVSSFLDNQIPIATEQRGVLSPLDIEEYKAMQGFIGFFKALKMSPSQIIEGIQQSGIRGRGGGGFPTGIKWERVAQQMNETKYIICNGDEGDPGAFMDRMLLESYPFRVIEGALIAAYAVGATQGFFYIRAEYPLAVCRIKKALEICKTEGYIGSNILGSGFNFDITIVEGAGAFVCGEETALIASIEGRRGFPTIRPPYPAVKGLFGKPTLVNNTETLAQIPYILREGSQQFASIGTEKSKGTKVFALAGKINRGGLIEVPMGMSIRQIVEEIGGGVADGKTLKAIQIGGPSGACIPHWLADTAVDFNSLGELGGMMGSGGLVVLDETDCMVEIARYFLTFTQNESCGKCTFCRVGTKRMLEILEKICTGKGTSADLESLKDLANWTKKGSLCGLGKTAPNPVLSTLNYFMDEYQAHIDGKCPTGKCKGLISYSINNNCIGCTKCAQTCPVNAIAFNPLEQHSIDQELCIQCDSCRMVCPEGAIDVN